MLLAPLLAAAAGLLAGVASAALVARWPPGRAPARLGRRGAAVTLASALLAAVAVGSFGAGPGGLAAALLLVALVPVVAVDLEHRLIPDVVVLPAAAAGLALGALADPARWWVPAAAAASASSFLLLLWAVHPAGMGLGDVKLALPLGAVLGPSVLPALVVAFTAGGLVAVALFARLGRRARGLGLPFGPFLAGGGALALWTGPAMLSWYAERLA